MHSITINGVSLENPTKEEIAILLPEQDEKYIESLIDAFRRDSNRSEVEFNIDAIITANRRAEINAWRDEQLILPVAFQYKGLSFKASASYVNILKAYADFLPPGATWTDENDIDFELTTEDVNGLLQSMQEALSSSWSSIHAESRARKRQIEVNLNANLDKE